MKNKYDLQAIGWIGFFFCLIIGCMTSCEKNDPQPQIQSIQSTTIITHYHRDVTNPNTCNAQLDIYTYENNGVLTMSNVIIVPTIDTMIFYSNNLGFNGFCDNGNIYVTGNIVRAGELLDLSYSYKYKNASSMYCSIQHLIYTKVP